MYSKKKKGQASIVSDKGRLKIQFPRELFGGKQKRIALGLNDDAEGRRVAEQRLRAIQADIDLDSFDLTLERYRPKHKRAEYVKSVIEMYPSTTLLELWNRYIAYKKTGVKLTTYAHWQTNVNPYLERCEIKSPYAALELREWLLEHTTEGMTKRVLLNVNAAFKWGMKHKLVKAPNPYEGMAGELKHRYERDPQPIAFTAAEKAAVLTAFRECTRIRFSRWSYSYYYPFVFFMFACGCRPSEAIGLRWCDIDASFSRITFNGGITQILGGKQIRTTGSKNNRVRVFPCNGVLMEFLRELHPNGKGRNVQSEALVFPSPTGKPINYKNFSQRAWDRLVNPIKSSTTPYSCRDTFITEQISKGSVPAVVAKWTDTSIAMIERHYLDSASLSQILPQ